MCLSDSFHLPQPNYSGVFRYEDYNREDANDEKILIKMIFSDNHEDRDDMCCKPVLEC